MRGCQPGLVSMALLGHMPADDPRRDEFTIIFGDPSTLPGSEQIRFTGCMGAKSKALPNLFVYCGKQEDLYPINLQFVSVVDHLACKLNMRNTTALIPGRTGIKNTKFYPAYWSLA